MRLKPTAPRQSGIRSPRVHEHVATYPPSINHDHVHRNVMRLGKYAGQSRLGKPKPNTKWATRNCREGPIVITASIPEAIKIPVEAHQRNNERLRSHHFPLP